MSLSPFEKDLAECYADLTLFVSEISKNHVMMANFVAQNLPAVPEEEKSEILARVEKTWLGAQQLQDAAMRLKKLL